MTQSPPFTLSARLSHLMKWTEEEVREEKEKGRKDHAKIVEARPGVISYLGPQLLSTTARSSKGWWGGVATEKNEMFRFMESSTFLYTFYNSIIRLIIEESNLKRSFGRRA